MLKAREALLASRNPSSPNDDDVHAAVAWLDADRQVQGAKKAAKVGSRRAGEGVVCVCVLHDGLPQSLALPKGVGEKMVVKEEAQGAGMSLDSPPQAAIVEVNCETDFVGKNPIFQELVRDLAHTAAVFPALGGAVTNTSGKEVMQEINIQDFLAFPLFSSSPESSSSSASKPKLVSEAIIDAISRLGENIMLSRACALSPTSSSLPNQSDGMMRIVSSFGHGGSSSTTSSSSGGPTAVQAAQGYSMTMGKVGSLLVTRFPRKLEEIDGAAAGKAMRGLTRSLSRQAAGMKTTSISSSTSLTAVEADERSEELYKQPFMMLLPAARPPVAAAAEEAETLDNSQAVGGVLQAWSQAMYSGQKGSGEVRVEEMRRWELGETLEAKEESGNGGRFAEEVRRAAGLV